MLCLCIKESISEKKITEINYKYKATGITKACLHTFKKVVLREAGISFLSMPHKHWDRSTKYLPLCVSRMLWSDTTASSATATSLFFRFSANGPWAIGYTSLGVFGSASMLRFDLDWHPCAHRELGSVALQTLTLQCMNTYECSPMNLKVSALQRWECPSEEGRKLTVSSTAHLLREKKWWLKGNQTNKILHLSNLSFAKSHSFSIAFDIK